MILTVIKLAHTYVFQYPYKGIKCQICEDEFMFKCTSDKKTGRAIRNAAKTAGWLITKRRAICPSHPGVVEKLLLSAILVDAERNYGKHA